jgi:hypothetical protein
LTHGFDQKVLGLFIVTIIAKEETLLGKLGSLVHCNAKTGTNLICHSQPTDRQVLTIKRDRPPETDKKIRKVI